MALPNNRILTLKDVSDNFENYNFIITTNFGTIDTSLFSGVNFSDNGTLGGIFTSDISSNKDSYMQLYASPTGTFPYSVKKFNPQLASTDQCSNLKESGFIRIYSHMVQDIKVKSKRNFLLNQKPTRKF